MPSPKVFIPSTSYQIVTMMGGFRLSILCETEIKSKHNINVIKGPGMKRYIHWKLTKKVHVGVGVPHFESKAKAIEGT